MFFRSFGLGRFASRADERLNEAVLHGLPSVLPFLLPDLELSAPDVVDAFDLFEQGSDISKRHISQVYLLCELVNLL